MAGTFGFFVAKHSYREWKGNMQRRFDRKLWTFILTLLLACGSVSVPTYVRADLAGDAPPSGPPAPDAGDPDSPQGPKPAASKVGPPKGANNPAADTYAPPASRWALWMKWAIRVAYGSTWRIFFRV